MTDEAADRPGPQRSPGAGPDEGAAGPDPAPSASTNIPGPTWSQPPPPGASDGPPPGGPYDPAAAPPPTGAGFTSRYGLVRPRQGRHLAGVCAAIGRATNTDPVLWRVLLAVLGFFGGIGILVYVAAWLIIPAEGDSASPVESMLGRGRSSMSPVTVIILGVLVAILFGFIVTDAFRAVLLGVAILITGALLLNRQSARSTPGPAAPAFTAGPPAGPGGAGPAGGWASDPSPTAAYPLPAPAPSPVPGYPPPAYAAPWPSSPPVPPPTPAPPPAGSAPPQHPMAYLTTAASSPSPSPALVGGTYPPSAGGAYPPPGGAGYRPAFAPHGPFASGDRFRSGSPPAAPPPARPPKPPRERSPLGAATFSMIFVAIGLVAILDLLDVITAVPSTYFAAILVTIALGLLVGVWFGRARWLIALGLAVAVALGISTLAESPIWIGGSTRSAHTTWTPSSYETMAERYTNRFGHAVLDLRQVDFTGLNAEVTVRVNLGSVEVIVPPEVDVVVSAKIEVGEARIFDNSWSGVDLPAREVTDLGRGDRGGKLLLHVIVNAGTAEVHR